MTTLGKITILGQGLAGTFASMQLQAKRIPHRVIDQPKLSNCSKIAAGLINPIVLKRLNWVADAELFLNYLKPFYKNWQQELATDFFFPIATKHLFKEQGQVNQWLEKSIEPPFKNHLGKTEPANHDSFLSAHFGLGELNQIFWLNTAVFLSAYRNYLQSRGMLEETTISSTTLHEIQLEKSSGAKPILIDCTGYLSAQLQTALINAFAPTKGEVVEINAPALPHSNAWHSKLFALPLGQSHFKVGATYQHDALNDEPSPKGLGLLQEGLSKIYTGDYTVERHLAGVRPNTKDRKPLLGKVEDNYYVLNGFGSRGALMGPYLAQLLIQHILEGSPIPKHWDVKRFI
jgi:glycine/D-amino acid oxidase-like deaminating enzyme